MNILYISKLSGNMFAGPNNSVPAQIQAQSKIDNVFWYNLNNVKKDEWTKLKCYNLKDYPTGRLADIPKPFNKPDIVIVEEFYCFPFEKIIKDIQINRIPYIIIPRSELTQQAQEKKKIKKVFGNYIYFNRMVKKSLAIQYLSEEERRESEKQWKKQSIVIPNGTVIKKNKKQRFNKRKIEAVYIGRYEKYQKGLDLLFEAIIRQQELLRMHGFTLNMYGVDQEETISYLKNTIKAEQLEDLISVNNAVFAQEKEAVLLNSDVFIMTSRFEGMPMGMIEALSYGLPCVATVGTNMADEINNAKAGWTAKNTVESIEEALKTMVLEKEKFREKSSKAIEVANKYSWENIAKKSHETFERLLRISEKNHI